MYSISYYETSRTSDIFFDAIQIITHCHIDIDFRNKITTEGRMFISITKNTTEKSNALSTDINDILPVKIVPHHSLRFICYEDYEKSITYSVGEIPYHNVYKINKVDLNTFLKILENGITRRMKLENFISKIYYKVYKFGKKIKNLFTNTS